MTFDLKAEYMRVMEQYKLTHPIAAAQAVLPARADSPFVGLESRDHPLESGPNASGYDHIGVAKPASAAPLTFADIPLGEEFEDEHGLVWEKRSEKRAIRWDQFGPVEIADFTPTDKVKLR